MPEWFETFLWLIAAFLTGSGAILLVGLLAAVVTDGNAPEVLRRWWNDA